jgi:hypothetical protein
MANCQVNYQMFCKTFAQTGTCKGLKPPDGDGSCLKVHVDQAQCDHMMGQAKEKTAALAAKQ